MKKFIISIFGGALVVALCSANVVSNAVYTVENGVYWHKCGDRACVERGHDRTRKISITSHEMAEDKLYLPCRKCAKY